MNTARKLVLVYAVSALCACGDDASEPAVASDAGDAGGAHSAHGNAGSGGTGGGRDAASAHDAGDSAGAHDAATAHDAGGAGADASSAADASTAGHPHPLYPALDLDTLPGEGGAASGAYQPPVLPTTTRTVTIGSTGAQAGQDLLAACQTAGTAVSVPDTAGHVGTLDFGNVTDCDVSLGAMVVANLVYIGHLPGPQVAPSQRIRIRGGQLGQIMADPGSSDIVFDGVTLNNAVMPPAQRSGTAIYLINAGAERVSRFAVVNSIIRMMPTLPDSAGNTDGCAYLAADAHDVFFANDNIVTAGNRNAWGFRIGGGDNFIIVDSTVRVSFHKLIRMNDGPVDYVYVKGGTWMREATLTADGTAINDAWAQLGDLGTDHVYIHDPSVYLLSAEPLMIGASTGPGQAGKSWELRRIAWNARSASVISDEGLSQRAASCSAGATCDYGIGTHSYHYDANLELPANPWRALPAIAVNDPDELPIAP